MTSPQHVALFRFYGALNDFLPASRRQMDVPYSFWGEPAVKDAIEAQGVPHPEVDLVLVNERPVSFDEGLSNGDRVSVYPWIQSLERPAKALRPPWPVPLRFLCDVHLGQLARYLRMMGFDTRYDDDRSDRMLARIADTEDRILLTRDIGLLKRGRVTKGGFVRAQEPRDQLSEVVVRFSLADRADPLSRCLTCNVSLRPSPPGAVEAQVPPRAKEAHDRFVQCPSCEQVYWEGTHVDRMQKLIASVTSANDDSRTETDPDTSTAP